MWLTRETQWVLTQGLTTMDINTLKRDDSEVKGRNKIQERKNCCPTNYQHRRQDAYSGHFTKAGKWRKIPELGDSGSSNSL